MRLREGAFILLPKFFLLIPLIASGAAQQPASSDVSHLSARELYFREKPADSDSLPKLATVAYKKPQPKAPDVATPNVVTPTVVAPKPPAKPPASPPVVPVVEHLGLRYRLLLVDKNTNAAQAVDPDSVFHNGDCLALELEPNRTGYLYVLAKESTGNWNPLFPNAQMEAEAEIVNSRSMQRAPQKFCFELDENKGTEHLYVILSRNPSEVHDLNMALLKSGEGSKALTPASPSEPAIMADASVLNKEANDTVAELGSRGFKISKTGSDAPVSEKYSVYVVPAALEKKDTVFAEIKINHQ